MPNPKPHWLTRLSILAPYAWLAVFFLVPFLIVLKISLSQTAVAQPPYEPLLDLSAGWQGVKAFVGRLSLDSYASVFADSLYAWSYWKSIQVAFLSTLILLLIGYPVAYALARAPRRLQGVLVLAVILPFWTSFLIRVYAWMNILQHDGLLNQALLALRIIDAPVSWLATDHAVYIGIVYSYFPFMVLPLYAALERMDETLLEAAADLGAPPWRTFFTVTVPLSLPGIVAGCLLCFIPITGEFVIPDLLGSSATTMIGQVLWLEFFGNRDWPVASALAVMLLVILVTPIMIYRQREARQMEKV
ncbi:MAG TPA: ABC transporter permease subunit [Xanthobacteraceae bacterium]|nr:ABC transporter permease subunit [Xanthobacteraceae bacterium]